MFQRFQYVILPSLKANWLRSMPDRIWASNCATDRSAAIGEGWNGVLTHCHNVSTLCHNGLTLCLYLSAVGSVGSSDGIDDPIVKLFGTGRSDWGRISGVHRRDGVVMYVEFSEDVTTVARDTYSTWCAENFFFVKLIIRIGPQIPKYNSWLFDQMRI